MLPTIPTLPSSASSESSSYWHRHLKMSKGTLAKKPQMDFPQGLTKGNGKQPYKVMVIQIGILSQIALKKYQIPLIVVDERFFLNLFVST